MFQSIIYIIKNVILIYIAPIYKNASVFKHKLTRRNNLTISKINTQQLAWSISFILLLT
jgi:hypothetical protein